MDRDLHVVGTAGGRIAVVLLLAGALARAAAADPADVVNALRVQDCAGSATPGVVLGRASALDAAARELAGGRSIKAALERVGYPYASTEWVHLRGSRADWDIRGILAKQHCAMVSNRTYTELGFHQDGRDTWIVFATRTAPKFAALRDPEAVAQRVLELVNAARRYARDCGRSTYAAAPPLRSSVVLEAAASLHALDMAEHGELSHEGSDGSEPGERITRAGYDWRGSGENIAAGQDDAEAVVADWLTSPGHCATLMEPHFTETGVAFALAPGQEPDVYWVQLFAVPP